jgi:lipoate-protein ligase B
VPEEIMPGTLYTPMDQNQTHPFTVQDFGLSPYETIWALQKNLVEKRLSGEIEDTLLLGEHLSVLTLGRNTHAENLLNPTLPVMNIERGGDVTYHGPGQLIAYPIFLLPVGQRNLHQFLRNLETVIIQVLADFGLAGLRNPGWTGVWVEDTAGSVQLRNKTRSDKLLKIASIGVAVRKWVTYHGLALNVHPDLTHFDQINPCGLPSTQMTSMQVQLGQEVSMVAVKLSLVQKFTALYAYD